MVLLVMAYIMSGVIFVDDYTGALWSSVLLMLACIAGAAALVRFAWPLWHFRVASPELMGWPKPYAEPEARAREWAKDQGPGHGL
jgi:hypothetical protein